MPTLMDLCVFSLHPYHKLYGLYDPLFILGETFLSLGRGFICLCLGVFVGHALDKPWVSNPPMLRRSMCVQACTETMTLPSANGECANLMNSYYFTSYNSSRVEIIRREGMMCSLAWHTTCKIYKMILSLGSKGPQGLVGPY